MGYNVHDLLRKKLVYNTKSEPLNNDFFGDDLKV
jgi:hypothetical protein